MVLSFARPSIRNYRASERDHERAQAHRARHGREARFAQARIGQAIHALAPDVPDAMPGTSQAYDKCEEHPMAEVPITIACGNYDRMPGDQRRPREGRRLRRQLTCRSIPRKFSFALSSFQEFDVAEIFVLELHPHRGGGDLGLCRHSGLRVAAVPPFRHLCPRGCRHRNAGGPARKAHRPAGIPDHRRGLDARHACSTNTA